MTSTPQQPPMDPSSDEASPEQLAAAVAQGDAYGAALQLMIGKVADAGAEVRDGDYRIGYAVEKAEGMYEFHGGELRWLEPGDDNAHIEVAVRDAADGRFVPGLKVEVTVVDADGKELGTEVQPMLWHPMLYHYGRNWKLPGDGEYTIRVHIEPPEFMRHDRINGQRFTQPGNATFEGVKIETGQG